MSSGCKQYFFRWSAKLVTSSFSNIKKNPKGGKKGQGGEGSGADWEDSDDEDDFSDLDDDEVSLGSMEEDFEEDMDEEGGVFMDVSEDDDNLGKVPFVTEKQEEKALKIGYLICNYICKFQFSYLGGKFGF